MPNFLGWSNGMTPDFDSGNAGSIPAPRFPRGLVRACGGEMHPRSVSKGHRLSAKPRLLYRSTGVLSTWKGFQMLVLTRKLGESIVIDGNIVVTLVKVDRNKVRIGIDAPTEIKITRPELDVVKEEQGK